MPVSFSTFERLKTKGVIAYKNRDYAAARSYLIEAAECMVELAESAGSAEVRRQREEVAAELIDLARDCDRQKTASPKRRQAAREAAAES